MDGWDRDFLRRKMMGCFLGKAAGGTLGMPYEGVPGPLQLNYYAPVPEDMAPNDDLDLQVLWACLLALQEEPVVRHDFFAEAWLHHVRFACDEYGVCIRNLRNGVPPPYSGSYDNWFVNGLGAAIRSEVWACLAPGNPGLAARYAGMDGSLDHAGDGLYAARFLAALESVAFTCDDRERLIDAGLSVIPADCRLAAVIRDTRDWCRRYGNPDGVRRMILERYDNGNFTDVMPNLGFVVMALLLGGGDFGRTVCLAVNCGLDTDCTGATVGAIMGLMAPEHIGEEWLRPIGRRLVLSPEIIGVTAPETLDGFVELLLDLREKVRLQEEGTVAEPDWRRWEIPARGGAMTKFHRNCCYREAPPMPESVEEWRFPGTMGGLDATRVPEFGVYMLQFRFRMDRRRRVRVMFATESICQAWVDGRFAFGRFGGVQTNPSFHRAALNTFAELELEAGVHQLQVAVAPAAGEPEIRWVLGVGDAMDWQWLPDAFYEWE